MAKKGATNAFLQHKEDGGLQVSNTHEQMFPYAHMENHSYFTGVCLDFTCTAYSISPKVCLNIYSSTLSSGSEQSREESMAKG